MFSHFIVLHHNCPPFLLILIFLYFLHHPQTWFLIPSTQTTLTILLPHNYPHLRPLLPTLTNVHLLSHLLRLHLILLLSPNPLIFVKTQNVPAHLIHLLTLPLVLTPLKSNPLYLSLPKTLSSGVLP